MERLTHDIIRTNEVRKMLELKHIAKTYKNGVNALYNIFIMSEIDSML